MTERVIYIGMSADIVHVGHVNIIKTANKMIADGKADRLIIGLLTCEAIESYTRKTIVPWEPRRRLLLALKGVDTVKAQPTLDYEPNLRLFKPIYCIHGSDWNDPRSAQYATHLDVIKTLQEWGGELIEPKYTKRISTTHIINEVASRQKP